MAQTYSISGTITNMAGQQPAPKAEVLLAEKGQMVKADGQGHYLFQDLPAGTYTLTAFSYGLGSLTQQVTITNANVTLHFGLKPLEGVLKEVKVKGERARDLGISRLRSVEESAIYEGKKSEVIMMSEVTANLATNNSRQVFAKVAGLNIWESDGAGLQLGIGGRGLSPNRTSNFNTRQNGYDISADALGYPESYYTPPTEALDRIEVVRGAASLQYGTQFGGMLNFVMKEAPEDKPFELVSRQTGGSFGLFSSFNSIGGKKGKFHYYSFYQYKRGDGWRSNSGFDVHTAYGNVHYQPTEDLEIKLDYTYMNYLAQQPGGLTDAAFSQNPRQSLRDRNWFEVKWNLIALSLDYRFNDRTKLNIRNFGLLSERNALGYLEKINRPDPMQERLLLKDKFRNFGNETRLIHRYTLLGNSSTLLVGTRYYHGFTDQKQGNGSAGSGPDFRYYPYNNNPSISDYDYPSRNLSVFTENIFNITDKFSLTPGVRYEWIRTKAEGRYDIVNKDQAGNVLYEERVPESRSSTRGLVLFGLGVSYKQNDHLEIYGNISQNYRAINFNDMRVVNANIRIDPNLNDEKGYSADLGVRGGIADLVNFDVSLFTLVYDNRLGLKPQKDEVLFTNYLLRTNIGKSRNRGVETFAEADILKLLYGKEHRTGLSIFSNVTLVEAKYLIEENVFKDKKVELAPSLIAKTGLSLKRDQFKLSYQYAYTSEQFTDATNSVSEPTAVFGKIPAYWVMDLSGSYTYKRFTLETGINNLTDNRYFTRRATAYPGPGIIPSDARNLYVTLQFKL
ncbi:TonB-dependent receptor domain-containing protein [Rufibacter tibetensis]|nr:TonB-dependent receptor [Rufibacter tibetensis]